MTFYDVLAAVTLIGAVLYLLTSAMRGGDVRIPWVIPAALFLAFAAFSLVTILQEGLTLVWANHTQNLWGLQVWMDLLFSVAIAWTFLVPAAKRHGMSNLFWGVFVAGTASIGLWAMMARILYLNEHRDSVQPA